MAEHLWWHMIDDLKRNNTRIRTRSHANGAEHCAQHNRFNSNLGSSFISMAMKWPRRLRISSTICLLCSKLSNVNYLLNFRRIVFGSVHRILRQKEHIVNTVCKLHYKNKKRTNFRADLATFTTEWHIENTTNSAIKSSPTYIDIITTKTESKNFGANTPTRIIVVWRAKNTENAAVILILQNNNTHEEVLYFYFSVFGDVEVTPLSTGVLGSLAMCVCVCACCFWPRYSLCARILSGYDRTGFLYSLQSMNSYSRTQKSIFCLVHVQY